LIEMHDFDILDKVQHHSLHATPWHTPWHMLLTRAA
jgi:hypothetical protein